MSIEYVGNNLTQEHKDAVWNLLVACDQDFYPPLSARTSTSQKTFDTDSTAGTVPKEYYESMLEQDFVFAREGGKLVGFLSFKPNYICPELSEYGKTIYMTTMCVYPEMRGHGISGGLYTAVEKDARELWKLPVITTRTWSTNAAQMYMLPKRGYRIEKVLVNDRGNGVDSVYFVKEQ